MLIAILLPTPVSSPKLEHLSSTCEMQMADSKINFKLQRQFNVRFPSQTIARLPKRNYCNRPNRQLVKLQEEFVKMSNFFAPSVQ